MDGRNYLRYDAGRASHPEKKKDILIAQSICEYISVICPVEVLRMRWLRPGMAVEIEITLKIGLKKLIGWHPESLKNQLEFERYAATKFIYSLVDLKFEEIYNVKSEMEGIDDILSSLDD